METPIRDTSTLAIPVVQGESARAHRNRLVGKLSIHGPFARDLPVGTRIEVTLELDRSGRLRTRADIPAIGRTFEDLAHVLVPTATLETAAHELAATARRADEVQRRAFEAGAPAAVEALAGVAGILADAERGLGAARGGDADAGLKLHRALLDLATLLDDAEATLAWPELEREARGCVLSYTSQVSQWGTAADPEISAYAKQKVPLIQDYGQTDLDRRVLVFIGAGAAFGRPILAPPGIPPERVAILRQAFDRTMADAAFLAEAAKLNMDIKPLGGAEIQKIAIAVVQAPSTDLTRAKELIGATK